MENISKAIIIVGGMLLAILIITLLVFLYSRISVIPQEQVKQHSETGIIEYNRSFEVYQKPLMYGTDIISVINKAVDHNMRNGLLHAESNFFSKTFVNPIYGELMGVEAKFNSKEEDLDFFIRVRIYYIKRGDDGSLRELEYRPQEEIEGHKNHKFKDIEALKGDNYKKLLNASGIDLTEKDFKPYEYAYDFRSGKEFLNKINGNITLVAGDPKQDVQANKSLMRFLEAESVTILNPDSEDKSWSRIVITPASAKLKKLIFKSVDSKTEYYQNGRIKKMYFEEI